MQHRQAMRDLQTDKLFGDCRFRSPKGHTNDEKAQYNFFSKL